jgi:hypothetical protein
MRGEAHEFISLAIVLPFIYSLMSADLIHSLHILLILVGVGIGSLVPDVDATDGRIMHGKYKWIGRFFKYIIYKPMAFLTKEYGHRKVMHSIRGMIYSIILCGIVVAAISFLVSWKFDISFNLYFTITVLSFFVGYSVGYMLHLFEDTHTVSGIRWFKNGRTWKGPVRTGTNGEWIVAAIYMVLGLVCLGVVVFLDHLILGPILLLMGVIVILIVVFKAANRIFNSAWARSKWP